MADVRVMTAYAVFRICMVSTLTFRSLTHTGFVFAEGLESRLVSFFCMHVAVQFSQHHLLTEWPSFPPFENSCCFCHRRVGYIGMGLFPAPVVVHWSVFVPVPLCLDYHTFVVDLELWFLQLCSSLSRWLWLSRNKPEQIILKCVWNVKYRLLSGLLKYSSFKNR